MRHLASLWNAFLNVLSGVPFIGGIVVRSIDQATLRVQLAEANAEIARLRAALDETTRALDSAMDDEARRRRDLSGDWATTGRARLR